MGEEKPKNRESGVDVLGIRVSNGVIYWGPYAIGTVVGVRGSVIKVLYTCPICGAVYSHARNWRYHMRVKHPDFLKRMEEVSYEVLEAYREGVRHLKGETA